MMMKLTVFLALLLFANSSDGAVDPNEKDITERCGDCWCIPDEGTSCPTYATGYNDVDDISLHKREAFESHEATKGLIEMKGNGDKVCIPFKNLSNETDVKACEVPTGKKDENVCAFKYAEEAKSSDPEQCHDRKYELTTYENESKARDANATVTHTGACGVCSSSKDFAYMLAQGDNVFHFSAKCAKAVDYKGLLTKTKKEAWDTILKDKECAKFKDLSESCGLLWYFKAVVDNMECKDDCNKSPTAPYTSLMQKDSPDCGKSKCRKCLDEHTTEEFTEHAGRTHTNSGITSIMVHNCAHISSVVHNPCSSGNIIGAAGFVITIIGLVVTVLNII